jgi:hypothetical protein
MRKVLLEMQPKASRPYRNMARMVMNAIQYRAALAKLGLTQVGAARLFGVNDATSRRWARYSVTASPARILLRLMLAGKVTIEDVEAARKGKKVS